MRAFCVLLLLCLQCAVNRARCACVGMRARTRDLACAARVPTRARAHTHLNATTDMCIAAIMYVYMYVCGFRTVFVCGRWGTNEVEIGASPMSQRYKQTVRANSERQTMGM